MLLHAWSSLWDHSILLEYLTLKQNGSIGRPTLNYLSAIGLDAHSYKWFTWPWGCMVRLVRIVY